MVLSHYWRRIDFLWEKTITGAVGNINKDFQQCFSSSRARHVVTITQVVVFWWNHKWFHQLDVLSVTFGSDIDMTIAQGTLLNNIILHMNARNVNSPIFSFWMSKYFVKTPSWSLQIYVYNDRVQIVSGIFIDIIKMVIE